MLDPEVLFWAHTEDARYCLPIGTKTDIIASMPLSQWKHVFKQRALNPHAQAEIRALTLELLTQCAELMPNIFKSMLPEETTDVDKMGR